MARMHSRKRGQAASKRPSVRTKPSWVRYTKKEVEMLIIKLAKEGNSASKIGLILRDVYGIPDLKKIIDKNVTKLLVENKVAAPVPEDLTALLRRAAMIQKHLEKNKQDMSAGHGLMLTESKIKRLVKYYKRINRLPLDWKYNKENIKMFIE